jgi:hypothetical protein
MQMWLLIALGVGSSIATGNPQSTDQEHPVVAQALADELAAQPVSGAVLVYYKLAAASAASAQFDTWLADLLPDYLRSGVPRDLFHRYWVANQEPLALSRLTKIGQIPIRLVRHMGEGDLPPTGGVYSFSRVGLTANGDSALVSVSFACKGLCGSEDLYLYVLRDGHWKRQRSLRSLVH